MSNAQKVTDAYNNLPSDDQSNEAELITALFQFEKILLSGDSPELIDLHWGLMRMTPAGRVRLSLRRAFVNRSNVEEYLLRKLEYEADSNNIADIIHILGRKRSLSGLEVARKYIKHGSPAVQEVCLYVLGWMGEQPDILELERKLLSGVEEQIRTTAGSALRQMVWRHPEFKAQAIAALKQAFYTENVPKVRARVVELIGSIAVKNLGIRESRENPNILLGDLEKAFKKTNQYLKTL